MNRITMSLSGGLLAAAVVAAGCKSSSPSSGTPMEPTTMMAPETNGNSGAAPATMPSPPAHQTEVAIPAVKPPAAKDLTHVIEKDQPFFMNEPAGASPKPIGMLKAGTKVLVVIPGADYSQVITDTGVTAYTPTEGLKALGK